MRQLPFNKPYLTGRETLYLDQAVSEGKISGNGTFTKKSQARLKELTGSKKVLLTTSCTDALEMCAILTEIVEGDEVIMPSFTFVSTANAFILRGAKVVFVDSRQDHPGMDEDAIEELITERTKVIVAVHYAGVACNMDKLSRLATQYGLHLIEDAAQAIDSYYTWANGTKSALGSIGELGAFSFHETKNIQCGEGGALLVNRANYMNRAEIIWEKGTNRAAFWRGEVDKYGWVDIGSSFLPSELASAFLYAQLQQLDEIQRTRKAIWNMYHDGFEQLEVSELVRRPYIPSYATNNGHMYYLVCSTSEQRSNFISYLKSRGIHAVFHYQSLHASRYFKDKHDGRSLPWSDRYSENLVRLPLHQYLRKKDVNRIIEEVNSFFT